MLFEFFGIMLKYRRLLLFDVDMFATVPAYLQHPLMFTCMYCRHVLFWAWWLEPFSKSSVGFFEGSARTMDVHWHYSVEKVQET
jgi:hypothetical protein